MRTKIFGIVMTLALLLGLFPSQLLGVSHQEVQRLLDRYDKNRLIRAILELRENRITVFVQGGYRDFTGPPSPEFVNLETLVMDLQKAKASTNELTSLLQGIPSQPKVPKTLTLKSDMPPEEPEPAPPAAEPVQPPEPEDIQAEPQESAPAAGEPTAVPAASGTETAAVPQPDVAAQAPAASLKQAALDCRVMEFLDYMAPSTQERVKRFEAIRTDVHRALEAFYELSHELFGDRVQRDRKQIRFEIDGTDPRWVEILGPQWAEMMKQNPTETPYFLVQVTFDWSEECRVLQKFQACLEDPLYCEPTPSGDSALGMDKEQGDWRIVEAKPPQEWGQAFRFGEGMVQILQWAHDFLIESSEQSIPYEDLMLSLAEGYFQRLQALMQEVTRMA